MEISHLLLFSVVTVAKYIMLSPKGYFISERPFCQFHKQQAKFANKGHHFYLRLQESGLLATVTLNSAHQAATKDGKWL